MGQGHLPSFKRVSIEGNRSFGGMFSPGEMLSASKLNDLAAAAGYGKQWHSSGAQVVQGAFGTVDLTNTNQSSDQSYDYPFKVSVRKSQTSGYDVFVRPGTVNNFVPKIGAKRLDEDPTPSLNFTSVSSTKKKIVALKVTKDGAKFFPNTVEVVLLDNEESLNPSDSDGYIQVASISCSTDGGTLSVTGLWQYIYASQVVTRAKPGAATAIWAFSSR